MDNKSEVLSVLDFLDLDEEIVDNRLRTIMSKSSITNRTLHNAIHLLQYKSLINSQDSIDCDNDVEFNFVVKMLCSLNEDNIDSCCTLLSITLSLNNATLLYKSEHLLQQIFHEVAAYLPQGKSETEDGDYAKMLQVYFYLKICDTILDTVSDKGMELTLPFLEVPLEHLLHFDKKVKLHFLVNTVPKLFHVVKGYNILDKIWTFIKKTEDTEVVLNVMTCLSNCLIPTVDENGKLSHESQIVCEYNFWDKIQQGLMSEKDSLRKIAIYLSKRSVDYLVIANKTVQIDNEHVRFMWSTKRKHDLKNVWDIFFILMESLEEKQSNIVIPSLQLFEKVKELGTFWLNCAFKIGLKHDNTLVKFKTIEYRLEENFSTSEETIVFLEAFNDINICDLFSHLNDKMVQKLQVFPTLMLFLRAMPQIKWSPTPLFCLSNILANVHIEKDINYHCGSVPEIIFNILKIPCTNVMVRKAVEVNITYLIGHSFKNINWEQYLEIYSSLKFEYNRDDKNPLVINIKSLKLNDFDKENFYNNISSKEHLDFALIYIENYIEDINIFTGVIEKKIRNINNIVTRQYSDRRECLYDVKFLMYVYHKTKTESLNHIHELIRREVPTLLKYIQSLASSEDQLTIKDCQHICAELDTLLEDREDLKTMILELYKSCILLLKSGQKQFLVLSAMVVNKLTNNKFLNSSYRHEMATLKVIFEIVCVVKPREPYSSEDSGRLNNVLFEQCSHIVQKLVDNDELIDKGLLVQFIEKVLDCGGYGCLKWILKIVCKQLPTLLVNNKAFNIAKFLDIAWKEIEELKSNSEYSPSMEAFIDLLLNKELVHKSPYNNNVLLYIYKILEYGYLKNSPLYYLIKKFDDVDITQECGHLGCALSQILLFAPIIRKDQRIIENVELEILSNSRFSQFVNVNETCFNYQLHFKAVSVLSKIKDEEILNLIANSITTKINLKLKVKQRYHGNSQVHKILQNGLQHLLTIIMNRTAINLETILKWNLDLMVKTSHQPSVRICMEWLIALYIITQNLTLSEQLYQYVNMSNIPIISQFFVLYWVAKYKIQSGCMEDDEFEFVMDKLLANTMGQMFNVRLNAQYLAKNLYELNTEKATKYSYTVQLIEKIFTESEKDKNFEKLKRDFFANHFNIVHHFTPCFIYYFLPRYCDQSNAENVDVNYVRNVFDEINCNINKNTADSLRTRISNDEVLGLQIRRHSDDSAQEKGESSETIQKKYIPWKDMTEVEMIQETKKKSSNSELVLVASLIDKLPNLGGMARTSEVFGVKTYVIDSLRHLQDKVFQGLRLWFSDRFCDNLHSVSAERWVDIEQVRPGAPLKEYLLKMKSEGYAVVAAEQTSSSVKLQNFKFPKKSVLLLGHEKEGIPCDFLPLMDHCVEIPQQGFVRSLNVHVTAAIFVWEYTRQNLL